MLPKIDAPTFKVKVPSTGKTITLRTMKVKEEKLLLMAKEGNDPAEILASVKQVVNNCVVGYEALDAKTNPHNILNLDQLAIFDIEYLFIKLRQHSVSETTEVAYIDNEEVATEMEKNPDVPPQVAQRNATRTFTVDLTKVEVKFPENSQDTIPVTDKIKIKLKYPPASLYSDTQFMALEGEKLVDMLVAKCIAGVYDGDKEAKFEEAELKEWLDQLDVKVYEKIKAFFSNLPHLYYEIKYTNKNGKDREILLTTLSDFFSLA